MNLDKESPIPKVYLFGGVVGGRGWGVKVQLWTLRGLGCCITSHCFSIMEQTKAIANSRHKTLQKILGVGNN